MEEFNVLCKGEGVIIYSSRNCDCVNVTLPNINIHINSEGLADMTNLIEQKLLNIYDENRTVFIETPCSGMVLYFKTYELRELYNLLVRSLLQLELNDIA